LTQSAFRETCELVYDTETVSLKRPEVIAERWRNWRRHDPINLVAKYRANLKSLRGIHIDAAGATSTTSTTDRASCRSASPRPALGTATRNSVVDKVVKQ